MTVACKAWSKNTYLPGPCLCASCPLCPQLANMCQDVVQDSSMKDLQHFQGMLDMDGSNELTQQQFSAALDKNRTLHKQVG